MTDVYVDTSALIKLLVDEVGSSATAEAIGTTTPVTSVLTTIELAAVVRRRGVPGGEARAAGIIAGLRVAPLSDAVLDSARHVPSHPPLRTLDLLHLATARVLRATGTTTFIAYDLELLDAARAEGFTVLLPA